MYSRDARLAPSRPAPRKNRLPRPAPQKLTKPAGRSGAKLTLNSKIKIWYPFSLCPQSLSQTRKKKEKIAFDPVYSLSLSCLQKTENAMFSFIKTPKGITNLSIAIYFFGSLDLGGFFAPPRTAPRIFTLALPCPTEPPLSTGRHGYRNYW